jgi:hypothetical protein
VLDAVGKKLTADERRSVRVGESCPACIGVNQRSSTFIRGSIPVFLSIDDHIVRLWFWGVFVGVCPKMIQTRGGVLIIYGAV